MSPLELVVLAGQFQQAVDQVAYLARAVRDRLIEEGFTKAQANKITTHLITNPSKEHTQ